MKNIEVRVLNVGADQIGTMNFLAQLTQKGHNIGCMEDLVNMHQNALEANNTKMAERIIKLPHGTIKRFSPITIAIVGASRRFLLQARTHQAGIDYVSASLQYSDYSNDGTFVVPYEILHKDSINDKGPYYDGILEKNYLKSCRSALNDYKAAISDGITNDTAGYMMPHALRNILIIQGNAQSLEYFIKLRTCNRNSEETQYVALKIWEELLKTNGGEIMFKYSGPDCLYGPCREGAMACRNPMGCLDDPSSIMVNKFPLLRGLGV